MADLLPLFVNLSGRRVVVVGGGPVAASKLTALRTAGAEVTVVAPEVHQDIEASGVAIVRRSFRADDLNGVWLAVAAATPAVNRQVALAAETRRVFVNAVDDPANASAFLSGVLRRDGVTIGISTNGDAPGLTALVREALDRLLPEELGDWMATSRRLRAGWKRDGVPMTERRPLLLQALNTLYDRSNTEAKRSTTEVDRSSTEPNLPKISAGVGHVSLVGAGPGAPGLLTRTGVARLRGADLVLYDALIDDRILRLARKAQRFFVGKRAGRVALSQDAIHTVMIRAARRGRRVVRLKGGDPLVFGRGGEEALALQRAGISFDIVPGVSSVVAAPALAGIPLTHRGLAGAIHVVSGHDDQVFQKSIGELSPAGLTLVVMMGLARRASLASSLLTKGWASSTPAAIISDASRPQQEVWRGSLDDLATGRVVIDNDGPALLVVGEVAGLRIGLESKGSAGSISSSSARGSVGTRG